MKFLINLEAQKSSAPGKLGYHLEKGDGKGIEKGIEKGIKKERLNAIGRMIKANVTKEQIIAFDYTEEEFTEAGSILYASV